MAYCTKCGKQNPDTSKFCTGCGNSLMVKTPPAATQRDKEYDKFFGASKKSKYTAWVIIVTVGVLGLGVGSYFLFFNKEKKEDTAKTNTNRGTESTKAETTHMTDQPSTPPESGASYTDMEGKFIYRSDCFVIITGSFADENYARGYVNTMKNEGHNNAGYLWIPDYPSLSGKTFYATFIGPYQTYSECENNLRTLKVNSRFWYGKKVSYNPEQIEIRIK